MHVCPLENTVESLSKPRNYVVQSQKSIAIQIHSIPIKSNFRITPILYLLFFKTTKGRGPTIPNSIPRRTLLVFLSLCAQMLHQSCSHSKSFPNSTLSPEPLSSPPSPAFHYYAIDLAAYSLKTFLWEEKGSVGDFRIFCTGPKGQRKPMNTPVFGICVLLSEHLETVFPPSRELISYTGRKIYPVK